MKTRFYMLNLLVGVALATLCLVSCGKGAFLDTDDPATRGFILDTFKPIDPIEPPFEFNPIICRDSNRQTVDSPLSAGLVYTFELEMLFSPEDIPVIDASITNSAGTNIHSSRLDMTRSLRFTFVKPDVYTVSLIVTTKRWGTKMYSRTYEVVGNGLVGGFDTTNPQLNVPFKLLLNSLSTGKLVLSVRETLFNDPQYTIREISRGYFEICIKEPGKYEFNAGYPEQGLYEVGTYHADVFYRPELVCHSMPIPGQSKYTNRLEEKVFSDIKIPWFSHRVTFSCYANDIFMLPKSYTAEKYASSVELMETAHQYVEYVYTKSPASGTLIYPNSWTVVYPRDTSYYFSGVVEIK